MPDVAEPPVASTTSTFTADASVPPAGVDAIVSRTETFVAPPPSPAELVAAEKATVAVKKEVRGAIKEGADGGQNSGDSGGSHAPIPKKTYTAEEKKACSIEAMRRGEECEACQ